MAQRHAHLQEMINAFAVRFEPGMSRDELHALYTDGCAVLLALETERLRLKRQSRAALAAIIDRPDAAHEAAALARRAEELSDNLSRIRQLVSELRTALDVAQDEERPPRRRFRRG